MIGPWEMSLQMESAQLLLASDSRERNEILAFLNALLANPYQDPDFIESSPEERAYCVSVIGAFLVTYGLDEAVKEVRVVRISRR